MLPHKTATASFLSHMKTCNALATLKSALNRNVTNKSVMRQKYALNSDCVAPYKWIYYFSRLLFGAHVGNKIIITTLYYRTLFISVLKNDLAILFSQIMVEMASSSMKYATIRRD